MTEISVIPAAGGETIQLGPVQLVADGIGVAALVCVPVAYASLAGDFAESPVERVAGVRTAIFLAEDEVVIGQASPAAWCSAIWRSR